MPTDQFWARAFLTPITLIFWLPFAFFFPLTLHFNLTWWQTALGFYLYYQLWGGSWSGWPAGASRSDIGACWLVMRI
ncbi:hypothetical protein [Nannocystis pusilla]|uniref:hypothetical protein n=1 Tax=Nannocystis pusilla TaxID=889268 RepID=UPI003DA697C2